MPRSADRRRAASISCCRPRAIAGELARLGGHPYVAGRRGAGAVRGRRRATSALDADLPHAAAGDAAWTSRSTRQTTIRRRIARRMVAPQARHARRLPPLPEASTAPRCRPSTSDLLISVTQLLPRRRRVRGAPAREVFPGSSASRPRTPPMRVWVPGCATGEEAYSLAIALLESLGDRRDQSPIQIFATDVSETAMTQARAGVYPREHRAGRVAGAAAAVLHRSWTDSTRSASRCATCASSPGTTSPQDPPFSQARPDRRAATC